MAEVTRLTGTSPSGGYPLRKDGTDDRPPQRKRPAPRNERAIRDVGSVMGIPKAELTPPVIEALTLIMHEMDRIRWDLEVSREVESYLEVLADNHVTLPILNRRAFLRELTKMAAYAKKAQTPGVLVYLDAANADWIKRDFGRQARDQALAHAAEGIGTVTRDTDIIGEIGAGEFGVILNLTTLEAAADLAAAIPRSFALDPFTWDGTQIPLEISWGLRALESGTEPSALIAAAEQDMRRRRRDSEP